MRRTRFEGDVERRPGHVCLRAPHRINLGVRLAGSSVPAFADDLAFAHDNGADSRVRRSQPPALAGQTQCFAHPLVIIHGTTGNIRIRCSA